MALGDELALKQFEVMLDMQIKKLQKELTAVREEVKVTREELHAEIRKIGRDAPQAPPTQYSGQFAPAPSPQWAQPPQQAFGAPQNAWGQQPPSQQQWQAPQAQPVNKWAPPPDKPPATVAIDRNNVAPSDVTIEKFFNFSGGARNR